LAQITTKDRIFGKNLEAITRLNSILIIEIVTTPICVYIHFI